MAPKRGLTENTKTLPNVALIAGQRVTCSLQARPAARRAPWPQNEAKGERAECDSCSLQPLFPAPIGCHWRSACKELRPHDPCPAACFYWPQDSWQEAARALVPRLSSAPLCSLRLEGREGEQGGKARRGLRCAVRPASACRTETQCNKPPVQTGARQGSCRAADYCPRPASPRFDRRADHTGDR